MIQGLQSESDNSDRILWDYYSRPLRPYIYTVLLTPTLCSLLGLPSAHLQLTPTVVFCILMIEYLLITLSRVSYVVAYLFDAFAETNRRVRDFGLLNVIEANWVRLQVPRVLRIFWTVRFIANVIIVSVELYQKTRIDGERADGESSGGNCSVVLYEDLLKKLSLYTKTDGFSVISSEIDVSMPETGLVWQVLATCVVQGCNNVIALMGMTSVLSYLSQFVGMLIAWFINLRHNEDRSIGTLTGVLFFILALQTGLTGMTFQQRLARLTRNMYLLITAILHFVHSMVNPILQTLSTQQHHLPHKHVRPIVMCVFLVISPCCLLAYLWSHYSIGTWLLAVTAFSVEVVIKVLISLLIYTLFMVDAYMMIMWDGLDDCIYWIKAVGNCVEFVFGIFLFFNGAWILLFESGGTIRAVMMCIHAYFNIWGQAQEGWATFMRRRSAVSKIDSLPVATAEELARLNDVCAICQVQMEEGNARRTACGHFFHGSCLRKWLYVQDICPMCHKTVYKAKVEKQAEVGDANNVVPINPQAQPNRDVNHLNAQGNQFL